jgi:hypothetical protein
MGENPDILVLQETKCVAEIAKNMLSKCWK